ncbi:MAG: magnesium transporter [Methanomicrobiaceae archaeon]|nr:magnesium transporter [Methanomicrobiaceae archaeon]
MTVSPARINGEQRLILLGLGALLASSIAATFAGIFLGSQRHVLELIPGLMVLVPPLINMRGSIAGVLASRLSSSMHVGTFEVDFRRNSVLGDNIRASIIITVLIAFVLGIAAYLGSIFSGIPVIDLSDIVLISVVAGILSGLIITLITLGISLSCYRFNLDLDMIAAPTVTTSGDLVTLPVLLFTALLITSATPTTRMVLFVAALLLTAASLVHSFSGQRQVRKIVHEWLPLLVLLSVLTTIAGLIYAIDLATLIAWAAFLILIPPFMGGCGSIGGILCSRLSTSMHMGTLNPSIVPEREVVPFFLTTYLYGAVIIPLLALIAHLAAVVLGLTTPGLPLLMAVSLGAGFVVLSLVNVIAYFSATLSFRYGLDPDNFGIPVITSTIDLLGAVVIIAVINIVV